jgi:hypothetical protein
MANVRDLKVGMRVRLQCPTDMPWKGAAIVLRRGREVSLVIREHQAFWDRGHEPIFVATLHLTPCREQDSTRAAAIRENILPKLATLTLDRKL